MSPLAITLPAVFAAGLACYLVLAVLTIGQPRQEPVHGPLATLLLTVVFLGVIYGFYLLARGVGLAATGQGSRLDVYDSLLHWLVFSTGIGAAYVTEYWWKGRRGARK